MLNISAAYCGRRWRRGRNERHEGCVNGLTRAQRQQFTTAWGRIEARCFETADFKARTLARLRHVLRHYGLTISQATVLARKLWEAGVVAI